MEYSGKTYKRKDAVNSDTFTVDKIEKYNNIDFVLFTNGAKCKLDTFKNDFMLADVNENNTTNNTTLDDDVIDPDKFFNSNVPDHLLEQAEKVFTDPNAKFERSRKDSVDVYNGQKQEQQQQQIYNADTTEESKPIAQQRVVEDEPAEYKVFRRAKKSEYVEILIPFKVHLPKANKIDTLDDMFEESFVSFLAKQFINKSVVNNTSDIEKAIQQGIEQWMEIKLSSSRKKAKQITVKDIIIGEIKVPEKPVETTTEPSNTDLSNRLGGESKPVKQDSIDAQLGRNVTPSGTVDVTKLMVITNENEFNSVKDKLDELKSKDIDNALTLRLEDMIDTWNLENK